MAQETLKLPTTSSHTGVSTRSVRSCWTDEDGRLYLLTELGIGLVHTQDVIHALGPIESGQWVPQPTTWSELPAQFAYQRHPGR